MGRCRQEEAPVSVIMFDLDRFKSVNDTHGHAFGDAVIKKFCEVTTAALRPGELVHLLIEEVDLEGGWLHARAPGQLRQAVHDNLDNLGRGALDVVNLRVGGGADGHSPVPGPIADMFTPLAELQQEGLIRHLGLSTVDAEQIAEAQSIAPVVCVQNFYNVAHRGDDDLVSSLATQGIAYVPYFPLGGFSPLQSGELDTVAARLGTTPRAVALAWLLQRSPNILLIPGTSSMAHLRENISGAELTLSEEDLATLDSIA